MSDIVSMWCAYAAWMIWAGCYCYILSTSSMCLYRWFWRPELGSHQQGFSLNPCVPRFVSWLCHHPHKELLNHPCFQGGKWKCQHWWLLKAGAEQQEQGQASSRHVHSWDLVQPDHRPLLHEYFKNSHVFCVPLVKRHYWKRALR